MNLPIFTWPPPPVLALTPEHPSIPEDLLHSYNAMVHAFYIIQPSNCNEPKTHLIHIQRPLHNLSLNLVPKSTKQNKEGKRVQS